MGILNLRGVEDGIVARVKAEAALAGETMVEYVSRVLGAQFMGGSSGTGVKQEVTRREGSSLKRCSWCGGVSEEWGPSLHCTNEACGRTYLR